MNTNENGPILAMIPVKNEAKRFLPSVLRHLSNLVSGIVILDDASTDGTPELCRSHPRVIRYHRLDQPLFLTNEAIFRELLWKMTVELNPSWILALDADEFPEFRLKKELPLLTHQSGKDLIRFPICHFWGSLGYYRVDGMWNPLSSSTACLYRYKKNSSYNWSNRKLHCGRFPIQAYQASALTAQSRILHFGYANRNEHQKKYERYMLTDPEGKFCPVHHYKSILDSRPELKKWVGEKMEVLP